MKISCKYKPGSQNARAWERGYADFAGVFEHRNPPQCPYKPRTANAWAWGVGGGARLVNDELAALTVQKAQSLYPKDSKGVPFYSQNLYTLENSRRYAARCQSAQQENHP